MSDLYQQVLLEELTHPQNKGVLPDADVSFHAVNASCGDDMTVHLKLDGDIIKNIRWEGSGCAISQATMSLLSAELIGKTINEVYTIQQQELEKMVGIQTISPGRVKCLLLGLGALQQAIAKTK